VHGTSVLHVHGSGIHLKDIAWRRSEDKKGGCDRSHGFDPHSCLLLLFLLAGVLRPLASKLRYLAV